MLDEIIAGVKFSIIEFLTTIVLLVVILVFAGNWLVNLSVTLKLVVLLLLLVFTLYIKGLLAKVFWDWE